MFQGLSLDQAPPISVPFRFFVTAPVFGILIGLVFFFFPAAEVFNRYSAVAVGLTHLFTLGILAMVIFGAMQQMIPVLAGVVIKKPLLFANVVYTSLVLGTLSLSSGFIFGQKILLMAGALFLAIAFLTFFIVILKLLFNVKFMTSTVKAIRLFAVAGLITALLGLYLAESHISGNIGELHLNFVNTHILFGLFGFAILLIMGVAFQVIPMFYVALDFPKLIQNKVPSLVLALIALSSLFLFLELDFEAIKIVFAFIFIIFSLYGIKSLNNRKRPVFDVTLWYWKLSFYSLIASMAVWLFPSIINYHSSLIAILFAFGFLYSLLQGMVYKIIPFLSWFHLSSKGYFTIPTLRDFIKEKNIKIQFFIYNSSLVFMLLATLVEEKFIYIGSALFIVSNLLFLFNMITGIKKYNEIAKTNPMDAFTKN